MASTSPFPSADDLLGDEFPAESDAGLGRRGARRSRRAHGKRASQRGKRVQERKQAMLEAMEHGLPSWHSLQPVLLFLMIPACLALGITVTGGNWPPEVLYPLALMLGLYVFFTALRGGELVLAVTLFYLPFSSTYVIPLAPGVNGTNMLILLGLFASVIRAADRRQGWIAWPPGTSIVFLFAVGSMASGITAAIQPGGLNYLLYHELLNYKGWADQFLLYFVALSCIRDKDTAKRMIIYMGIGAMILVVYAVPEMLEKMGRSTIEKSRIEGPHRQSNNFGGFVAYTLLPLGAIFLTFIKDIRAWLLTPYFLLAIKVLITTFSRGAYLAMAVGGFLAAYYKGKGFMFLWATIVVCFVLVFPSVLPQAIVDRLSTITEQTANTADNDKLDKSSEHRLILWRAAGKMILEDPITGKGFKYFQKLKKDYTEKPVHESDPHNMYLYIASQMGLPVASLFLLLLAYSFHLGRLLSRNREDRFVRAIGIGGAASTACYAVICLFGSRAVNLEFTAYFWTYLVCMQVLRQDQLDKIAALNPRKQRTNAFEAQSRARRSEEVEAAPQGENEAPAVQSTSSRTRASSASTATAGSSPSPASTRRSARGAPATDRPRLRPGAVRSMGVARSRRRRLTSGGAD